MKIIKQGKTKEELKAILNKTKRFECKTCGCVFEADEMNNPIKGQRWSIRKPEPIMAQWIPSKYFIKCSNCGYELFNSYRIAAPRKCPKCDTFMYELFERPSGVIEHLKLAILKGAAEEIMYGKKKEEK